MVLPQRILRISRNYSMAKTTHKPFNFTLPRLEALTPADKPYEVADTGQPGMSCRVLTSGVKTLQVHKRPKGSNRLARIKICEVGELALNGKDGARECTRKILSELAVGINPNEQARLNKALEASNTFTLSEAISDYVTISNIKEKTANGYKSVINNHLKKWLNLPLKSITGSMVATRHREISKKYPVASNNTMRVLRLLFNHYRLEMEDDETGESPIPNSPTRKLRKKWNRETRRQTYIKPDSIKDWWEATEAITATRKGTKKDNVPVYAGDGVLARDYLQFVILTGLRRREASQLTWDRVDLKNKVFIVNTKNGHPLELPLSDYLLTMLKRRREKIEDLNKERPFEIEEVKKFVQWVRDESKLYFTVHDLRRTFITYAESLDLGIYTLKALVNHRSGGDTNDVTAGYIVITTERLRKPMQDITDFILKMTGVKETKVISIGKTKL